MAPPMPPALTPETKSLLDDRPLTRMVPPVTLPVSSEPMLMATPPPPAVGMQHHSPAQAFVARRDSNDVE